MDVGAVNFANWSARVASIDPEAMYCFAVIDAAFCLGECGPEHLKCLIDQIVLAQAFAAPGYPGAVDADFDVPGLGSAGHPKELASIAQNALLASIRSGTVRRRRLLALAHKAVLRWVEVSKTAAGQPLPGEGCPRLGIPIEHVATICAESLYLFCVVKAGMFLGGLAPGHPIDPLRMALGCVLVAQDCGYGDARVVQYAQTGHLSTFSHPADNKDIAVRLLATIRYDRETRARVLTCCRTAIQYRIETECPDAS